MLSGHLWPWNKLICPLPNERFSAYISHVVVYVCACLALAVVPSVWVCCSWASHPAGSAALPVLYIVGKRWVVTLALGFLPIVCHEDRAAASSVFSYRIKAWSDFHWCNFPDFGGALFPLCGHKQTNFAPGHTRLPVAERTKGQCIEQHFADQLPQSPQGDLYFSGEKFKAHIILEISHGFTRFHFWVTSSYIFIYAVFGTSWRSFIFELLKEVIVLFFFFFACLFFFFCLCLKKEKSDVLEYFPLCLLSSVLCASHLQDVHSAQCFSFSPIRLLFSEFPIWFCRYFSR